MGFPNKTTAYLSMFKLVYKLQILSDFNNLKCILPLERQSLIISYSINYPLLSLHTDAVLTDASTHTGTVLTYTFTHTVNIFPINNKIKLDIQCVCWKDEI
jgi:hypothetical protein